MSFAIRRVASWHVVIDVGQESLAQSVAQLEQAGAQRMTVPNSDEPNRCSYANTLLVVQGTQFLKAAESFADRGFRQYESLVVLCQDVAEIVAVIESLEGNLTGCIYSAGRKR
ncbi:MAG: hypothetical protein R3B96_25580 [Pirellulaceae bacterium]